MKLGLLLLFLTLGAWAQPLMVYSELAEIDSATGRVIAPESPREILSPLIVRNGFTSFQLVVDVTKGTPYQLFVALNPEDSVKVTLYREDGKRLTPVTQPAKGDSPALFWMDVWRAKDSHVERIKIEPQLRVKDDWVIYPIEGRVVDVQLPDGKPSSTQEALCGMPPASVTADLSVASLRQRNAQQDLPLAAKAPRSDLQKVCGTAKPDDPEGYLRVRDFLFRQP